jgi:hypothetical protein
MSRKRRFIVVPRNTRTQMNGLQTGKRKLDFGKQTARWIDDPAEARDIDTRYGLKGSGDVWVEQDENLEWHAKNDNGTDGRMAGIHHYTFQGVDMSNVRTTRDNGLVWVYVDGKQKLVKKQIAVEEGYEIVPKKREKRPVARMVQNV